MDESALVEAHHARAERAVLTQLRSMMPSARRSCHLIGGSRSEEFFEVQAAGLHRTRRAAARMPRPTVELLHVDAIKAAAYDSSPQRCRAPPASSSARQSTMAAWRSLELTRHNVAAPGVGTALGAQNEGSNSSSLRATLEIPSTPPSASRQRAFGEANGDLRHEWPGEEFDPSPAGTFTRPYRY